MENRITKLFGCTVPIIEGGLAYVGNGALAAAVSNGGGFGQVGAGGRTAAGLAEQIQIAASQTSRPFGVNLPLSEHRDPTPVLEVIRAHRDAIHAVTLSAGNPIPYIQPLRDLGLVVATLASTPRQAAKAEAAGADAVICEGTEAGGHNGPAELTTMALIPAVTRMVSIPVIAAGGIANGETAAAAFCLGAEGIQMGTRFVATLECEAHEAYKQLLVTAQGEDTRVMERTLGRITRVLKSPFVDHVLAQEAETPGDIDVLLPLIAGSRNQIAAIAGKVDEGWLNCGQSVGLIDSLMSAADVVEKVYQDAVRILETRLRLFQQP